AAAAAAIVCTTGIGLASATTLPPTPPDVDPGVWAELMGPTPADWAPSGTVVADSGFEVWRDSFSFFNWGLGAGANSFLGYPMDLNTGSFTNNDLITLFGADIGCTSVVDGQCIPNPIASLTAAMLQFQMLGGHCYGMAALASQVFNQTIDPSTFTGSAATWGMRLDTQVGRQIKLDWSKQMVWLTDEVKRAEYTVTSKEAIDLLKKDLVDGSAPYILTFFFPGGGHAITPIAVRDKGAGKYDIVVYDNNYPLRERAFRVDTVANTWEYLVMTQPGQGPVIARGTATSKNLQLVPVETVKEVIPCAACEETADGQTYVWLPGAIGPNAMTFSIVGMDDQPIPGVKEIPATNPAEGDLPSWIVPTDVPFKLIMDNRAGTTSATFPLMAFPEARGFSTQAHVPAGQRAIMVVNTATSTFTVDQSSRGIPAVTTSLDTGKSDLNVDVERVGPRPAQGVVSFSTSLNRGNFVLTSSVLGGERVKGVFTRTDPSGTVARAEFGTSQVVRMRTGDRIVAQTATWTGNFRNLTARLVRSDGTVIPLTLTRPAN
ncbi:MAG: hypothetical protein RL134_2698, partial [Actinomycetota bacterium]